MTAPAVRHRVHRAATPEDVIVGAALIATAFAPLPACEWLVPDPEQRVRVLSSVLEIIVAHAVDNGEVHLLFASRGAEGPGPGLGIGAAVWVDKTSGDQDARDPALVFRDSVLHGSDFRDADFPGPGLRGPGLPGSGVPQSPDPDVRLLAAAGEFTPRFAYLERLFKAGQPPTPHQHLAFLAALPAYQNAGIAGTLLSHHHAHLDRIGRPAYLEAFSPGSRRLYARHGYSLTGNDFALPNGAVFYRMWRPPTDVTLI